MLEGTSWGDDVSRKPATFQVLLYYSDDALNEIYIESTFDIIHETKTPAFQYVDAVTLQKNRVRTKKSIQDKREMYI